LGADAVQGGRAGGPEVLGGHSRGPENVLSLSETLDGTCPRAYVLGISGYEYCEVKEGLSGQAAHNLAEAEAFFLDWLQQPASQHETASS